MRECNADGNQLLLGRLRAYIGICMGVQDSQLNSYMPNTTLDYASVTFFDLLCSVLALINKMHVLCTCSHCCTHTYCPVLRAMTLVPCIHLRVNKMW